MAESLNPRRWAGIGGVLFVLGLALAVAGTALMRGASNGVGLPRAWLALLLSYQIGRPAAFITGGAVALAGALLAGWAARRAPPDALGGPALPIPVLRRAWPALAALVLAVGAAGLLYFHLIDTHYTPWDIALFFAGLALVGFAVDRLDRRDPLSQLAGWRFTARDALCALGLGAGAVLLNLVDLTRWNFAWIGDEGAFFGAARDVAAGGRWDFFDLTAVYNSLPQLDVLWQALWIRLLGPSVFGWRLSEVLVMGLTTALVYLLGTVLLGRWPALAAAVVLGSSYYLMAFTRIAYDNTHGVFFATLAMLMLALAWRTGRAVFVFALGAALGFCLYTFPAALLTLPIVALLFLVSAVRRPRRGLLLSILLVLIGFVLVVAPALLTTTPAHLLQVMLASSHREASATNPVGVAWISLVASVVAFWQNDRWHNHYIGGPLLDPISAVLLILGLAMALFRLRRRGPRLALVWFGATVVLVAASNYVPLPSLTRLLMALPAAALLAGFALAAVGEVASSRFGLPRPLLLGATVVVLALIPLLNLYALLVDSPAHLGANRQVMLLKAIQDHPAQVIVEVGPQPVLADARLGVMMRMYPSLLDHYRYLSLTDLAAGRAAAAGPAPPVYLVDAPNQALVAPVAAALPAGYRQVTDTHPGGMYHTVLFLPPSAAPAPVPVAGPPPVTAPQPATEYRLPGPVGSPAATARGLAVDPAGMVYVATADSVIHKYDPGGRLLLAWGNRGGGPALFTALTALAADAAGGVYALDAGAGVVLHFDGVGRPVGAPITGLSRQARSLSLAPGGDLLVADPGAGAILRFRPDGHPLPPLGGAGGCPAPLGGLADAQATPTGDLFVLGANTRQVARLSWWWCVLPDPAFMRRWPAAGDPADSSAHLVLDRYGRLFQTAPPGGDVLVSDGSGQLLARWPADAAGPAAALAVDAQDNVYLAYPRAGLVRQYRLAR